jgi:putative flippase GtrA
MVINMDKNKFKKIYNKLVNRETISYLIAGVLTTIVNLASFEALCRMGIEEMTSNPIAWVIAVTFAYVVNKKNVFQSKSDTIMDEVAKIAKFYGARLVSLGIEQLGLYIFLERMGFNRLLVKAGLSIFVVIINYVFSKVYIFNKTDND